MSFELVGVKLVAEEGSYFSTMAKADKAVVNFGDTADKTFKQMPSLADIATGALHRIGTMAVDVFFQAGQAAIGFFSDSVTAAADFQDGMNNFSAVAGDAVADAGMDLKDFHDLFLQLGKDLPVSTKEVQDAAIEMAKGGIEPATIAAGGLETSLKFAAATGIDLAAAAETAAKIIGGWADVNATAAEKADLLTHSTDLLTKAANASVVDVDDLSRGLYNVQGTAKTAGLSLDETVTALAEIAPRFTDANTAGTSFRNFLVRLQPSTNPAKDAMFDLGLYTKETGSAFFDAQGKFVGVAQASQILQDATKDLTDAQKTQALQTIFGNDAMNAAAAFAELGADGYTNMTISLEKANGVAENAAIKQESLSTAWKNFTGTVEMIQIQIGELLIPILTQLFKEVIQPGINILADLVSVISGNQEALSKLPEPILVILGLFQMTIDQGTELSGSLSALSGVWDTFMSVVQAVGDAYMRIINAVLPYVSDFVEEHGAEIQSFFQNTFDTIVEIITLSMELYKAIIVPILNFIASFIEQHGDTIKQLMEGTWKIITGIIDAALTLIKGILKAALQVLQGDWEGAWTTIQEMSARFVADILQVVSGMLDNLQATFNLAVDGILAIWDSLIGESAGIGNDIIHGIIQGVKDASNELFNALRNIANDALESAKSVLDIGSPSQEFAKIGTYVMDGLVKGITQRQDYVLTVVEDMMLSMSNLFVKGDLPSKAMDLGQYIMEGIGNGIENTADWAIHKIEKAASKLQDVFKDSWGIHSPSSVAEKEIGIPIGMGVLQGINKAWSMPANPMALMAGGSTANTYNQNRNVNLNYQTTYAPPVNQSLAIARALA